MRTLEHDWLRRILWGCTFDDFLISPLWGVAEHRGGISLASKFSEHITLNRPLVSANMDTITESRMAVAFAKEGGLGIIHRYITIEGQCLEVAKVKREENFVVENPYHISPTASVKEARRLMDKNRVGCLVVINDSRELLGILGSRDVRFSDSLQIVEKRMRPTKELVFASPNISLSQAKELIDKHRIQRLPLVDGHDGHFFLKGLITSKDIENLEKYPLANKDTNGQLVVGAAIGAMGDYLERAAELIKAKVDVIVLDIANAQSVVGERAVREFKKRFSNFELVVGNIVLPEAVKKFQDLGAHGLKVGLGPGSACTTRRNTNIGIPQLQAIYECSVAAKIPVCSDGGVKRNGHFATALIFGGSSVMIGGMLAGTEETPGKIQPSSSNRKVKKFRGMASREAMHERLMAEETDDPYLVSSRISPEGLEKEVEVQGSATAVIENIVGHLASTVSYMGATSLQEAKQMFMERPSYFLIKLSESAKRESWDR